MRKQLAKVGAVTVAAMMVGTTAFAANLEATDIEVVYTGLNTVTISVPVANTSDNATILSVANGTLLDSIGNDNANDKIVYIDQDGVSASAANLRIADAAGEVEFTFNTERAGVAETDGKIDIFAAGSTYGVNAAAASIYKNAPAKSFAFTDATGISLPAGADAAAIKAAFADKNVTVTHQTTGADVTSTTTGANAGMSYALNGNSVTVTFDPALAENAKYDSVSGDPLTVEVPVTVEEAPPVISGAKLVVSPTKVTLPMGTTKDQITEALLKSKLTVAVEYTVSSGSKPENDSVAADDYSIVVSGEASPYTATISTTKQFQGFTPANATVSVIVSDTAAVAITGTVKTRMALTEMTGTAVAGAVVTAFDSTGAFAGAAVTDEAGAYSLEVANGTYTLVASYQGFEISDGDISFVTTYASVAVGNVEVSNGAEVDEIILTMSIGDANGDGVTDDLDYQDVLSFYGGEYK